MASLETIVGLVKTAVPHHDRTIIRPELILPSRTASCFGRAALVGAALLENGLPEDALSLLISQAHGRQRKFSEGPWVGHVALVIDTPEQAVLVDTSSGVTLESLGKTTWQRGVGAEDQSAITGLDPVEDSSVGGVRKSEAMAYMGEFMDVGFMAARDSYTAHPFHEGVATYQASHPIFSEGPIVHVADYARLYAELAK